MSLQLLVLAIAAVYHVCSAPAGKYSRLNQCESDTELDKSTRSNDDHVPLLSSMDDLSAHEAMYDVSVTPSVDNHGCSPAHAVPDEIYISIPNQESLLDYNPPSKSTHEVVDEISIAIPTENQSFAQHDSSSSSSHQVMNQAYLVGSSGIQSSHAFDRPCDLPITNSLPIRNQEITELPFNGGSDQIDNSSSAPLLSKFASPNEQALNRLASLQNRIETLKLKIQVKIARMEERFQVYKNERLPAQIEDMKRKINAKYDSLKAKLISAQAIINRMNARLIAFMHRRLSAAKTWMTVTVPQAASKFINETLPALWWKMLKAIGTFFTETVPKIWKSFWNGFVLKMFNAISRFFTETVPSFWKGLCRFVVKMFDAIGTFFSKTLPKILKSFWKGLSHFVVETIPWLALGLWGFLGKFCTLIGVCVKYLFDALVRGWYSALSNARTFFLWLCEVVPIWSAALGRGLRKAGTWVIDNVKLLWDCFSDGVLWTFKFLWSLIKNVSIALWHGVVHVWEFIVWVLSTMPSWPGAIWSGVKQAFVFLGKVCLSIIKGIGYLVCLLWEGFVGIVKGIGWLLLILGEGCVSIIVGLFYLALELGRGLGSALLATGKFIVWLVGTMPSWLPAILYGLQVAFWKVGAAFVIFGKEVYYIGVSVFRALKSFGQMVLALFGEFWKFGKFFFSNLPGWLWHLSLSFVDTLAEICGAVRDAFVQLWEILRPVRDRLLVWGDEVVNCIFCTCMMPFACWSILRGRSPLTEDPFRKLQDSMADSLIPPAKQQIEKKSSRPKK